MTFRTATGPDPLGGFRFAVTMAEPSRPSGALAPGAFRSLQAGFSEVSGLGSRIEVHTYAEGGRNETSLRFPTRAEHTNLTFRRGVVRDQALFEWFSAVRYGSFGARRNILVAHLESDGSPALIWLIRRALPVAFVGPTWDASQSTTALESLEVAHEGLDLLPMGAPF